MMKSYLHFGAALMGTALLTLGVATPSAQASPAQAAAKNPCVKDPSKIKNGRTITLKRAEAVVIRPAPVKSEKGALGQIDRKDEKGRTIKVTTRKAHWDNVVKQCVDVAEDGEYQDVCGSGDPTRWYYVVWVPKYQRVGDVPAGYFW